jgi:hypothetical protein
VQHGAGEKVVSEPLAQPLQVSRVGEPCSRGGLDLDGEDVAGRELGDQIDLVPPSLARRW